MSWTLYYIIIMLLEQTMICTEFVIVQNQLSWAAVNQNSITRLSRKKVYSHHPSGMNLYIHKTIKPYSCQTVRVHFFPCQTCRAGVTPTTMFVYILVWWWQNIKKMSLNMPRPRIREGGVVLRLPALLIFRLLLHKRTRVVVLWLL